MTQVFSSQMPKLEHAEFMVNVEALGENAQPVVITQNEYMRRMKEMSQFQPGMSFYQQMPDSYNLVLNSEHPLIKKVLDDTKAACGEALAPIDGEIKSLEAKQSALKQLLDKKKPEELTQEEKDERQNTEKAISEQKEKRNSIIAGYAKDNKIVHQLIDLALLQNGMLKGAALNEFLKRSVDIIGK